MGELWLPLTIQIFPVTSRKRNKYDNITFSILAGQQTMTCESGNKYLTGETIFVHYQAGIVELFDFITLACSIVKLK